VADGGFPPLTLQPVNFDQLYAQRMQSMMKQQGSSDAGAEDGGPAVKAEFPGNS
jgi:preprotein translocase subunit SecB